MKQINIQTQTLYTVEFTEADIELICFGLNKITIADYQSANPPDIRLVAELKDFFRRLVS